MRSERAEMAFSPLGLGVQALHSDRGSCKKSLYLDAEGEETPVVLGGGRLDSKQQPHKPATCVQCANLDFRHLPPSAGHSTPITQPLALPSLPRGVPLGPHSRPG